MVLGSDGSINSNPFLDFQNQLLPRKRTAKKSNRVPTAPAPRNNYSGPKSSSPGRASAPRAASSSSGGGRSSGGGGRSGGGGGGGGGGMSGAERRAIARENAAKTKAANRFLTQSRNLEGRASALIHALKYDYKRGLNIHLGNVAGVLANQQKTVNEGYLNRLTNLKGNVADNEKSEAGQSTINAANLARERNSAVAEALSHGAGETDTLNAQLMSLRNWNANQSEVLRSYHDTLRSTNTSLTDLNEDTRTAMSNNEDQANADREQLWTNYYNQRSESYIELGNTRGQQADYLAQANEMKAGSGKGTKTKAKQAKNAWTLAGREKGHAWKNPGPSATLKNWRGEDPFEAEKTNDSRLEAQRTTSMRKKPEGATLRKW